MQRLSIIVPLMGNLKRLEDTLVSVLENQPERSEVVVVLNAPYDDPYELRGEVRFVEAPRGADLVDCFACGLAASTAPVVHTIASGFEATPGWADAALARFSEAKVAAVAPLVVDRDNPDRILTAGLRWTSAGSVGRIAAGRRLDRFAANDRVLCGPELAVAFYRRDVLETVKTLQHHGSEMATALDLGLAMRKAGYCSVQEPACVTTATGELLASGGAWREGVARERLFCRWTAVPGWKRSRAAHAALLAMECLQIPLRPSVLARLTGRFWAVLGFGSPRPVVIGPQVISSQKEAVIRPHHFGTADARPALQSRVAG
ncbi:MAG: hypothetical protein ACLP9L_11995 [Thermoguttaceae bacterium]